LAVSSPPPYYLSTLTVIRKLKNNFGNSVISIDFSHFLL
jgi:hypothetical protein